MRQIRPFMGFKSLRNEMELSTPWLLPDLELLSLFGFSVKRYGDKCGSSSADIPSEPLL